MKSIFCMAICLLTVFVYSQAGAETVAVNFVDANTANDYGPQDGIFDAFENFASINNNGFASYRTALEFDISAVPAGSTINSATLYAYIGFVDGGDNQVPRYIALHGYVGDGVVQLDDFSCDGLVDSMPLSVVHDSPVEFNVGGVIARFVTNGEKFVGFNLREDPANNSNFGVIGLDTDIVAFLSIDFTPPMSPQYYFDPAVVNPWGWQIRRTIYENGSVQWALAFSLRSKAGQQVSWNDIEKLEIYKKKPDGSGFYPNPIPFSYDDERDDYLNIIAANLDPQMSWLSSTCPPHVAPFNCYFPIHESNAVISGLEPQLNEIYKLEVKLKGNRTWISSPEWMMPITMNLKPIPFQTAKTITNKKGKVIETGDVVPAISINERDDGSLVVRYTEPFIEETPPPLVLPLNQGNVVKNAWQGTHIRLGMALLPDASDPSNWMYLVWPNIPSNVGTVVFPKELVNAVKRNDQFTGTVYFRIQHRDRLNTARWPTGSTSGFPYTFLNPEPVESD